MKDAKEALDLLQQGLKAMQINLSQEQQQQILEYVKLLTKWNAAYNLTAVRTADQIMHLHILDSLTLLPFMSNRLLSKLAVESTASTTQFAATVELGKKSNVPSVLDVGTGAGLPGIPLAIAKPEISLQLLDSQQKKINFVQHVITSLRIPNVTAMQHRIETFKPSSPVDMIVSRAFASLGEFVTLIADICSDKTNIVAMKGRRELVLQEAQALPKEFVLLKIEEVKVPGVDAERCLVFLKRKSNE